MDDAQRRQVIRGLNDRLRRFGLGGEIYLSAGIAARSDQEQYAILQLIREFEDFSPNNDPHGEHDMVFVEYRGTRIIAKIDYYDKEKKFGSEDPANPNITTRVMTIMESSEY